MYLVVRRTTREVYGSKDGIIGEIDGWTYQICDWSLIVTDVKATTKSKAVSNYTYFSKNHETDDNQYCLIEIEDVK